METKIQVKNLFKIFGPNPQRALKRIDQGETKEDIFCRHRPYRGGPERQFRGLRR